MSAALHTSDPIVTYAAKAWTCDGGGTLVLDAVIQVAVSESTVTMLGSYKPGGAPLAAWQRMALYDWMVAHQPRLWAAAAIQAEDPYLRACDL